MNKWPHNQIQKDTRTTQRDATFGDGFLLLERNNLMGHYIILLATVKLNCVTRLNLNDTLDSTIVVHFTLHK